MSASYGKRYTRTGRGLAVAFSVLLAAPATAAAEPSLAPATATWRVKGAPGSVTLIVGAMTTGERIVADRFVSDKSSRDEERRLSDSSAAINSCWRASLVRPFTRLQRFSADGRLLWKWDMAAEGQALRLNTPLGGDCLSPDGKWLSVEIAQVAQDKPIEYLVGAIADVDRHPRIVDVVGEKTGKMFDDSFVRRLVGWKQGQPATLMFDVYLGDDNSVIDEAVLSRRRKR